MNTNTNTIAQGNNQGKYHNLTLSGFAYLNDIREVKSRKGSFIAVRVKMLQGEKEDTKFLFLNCNVFGRAAEILSPYMAESQKGGLGVRGRIRVSDLELRTFEDKAGKVRPDLYGRLFSISSLFVGDEKVYSQSEENADESQAAA